LNILLKNIYEASFDDVVDFCKEENIEGTTLDYKKDIPRDLAKHFAAFSNTLGGIIIIGVEEDPETGLPVKWTGIPNEGKLIERIQQFAMNVTPIPSFRVRVVENNKNKKVFVLIKIFEGSEPPYTTLGSSNIMLRTGNISTHLTQANKEELQRLYNKRNKADSLRKVSNAEVHRLFNTANKRADSEREQLIKSTEGEEAKSIYSKSLLDHACLATTIVQPYSPDRTILPRTEIKNGIEKIRIKQDYPPFIVETVPGGVFWHGWGHYNGIISAGALYEDGLVFTAIDVRYDDEGKKLLVLYQLAKNIYETMLLASNYYKFAAHNGTLRLDIHIDKTGKLHTRRIQLPNMFSFEEISSKPLRNDAYSWEIEIDTNELSNMDQRVESFKILMSEIYWDLGLEQLPDQVFYGFMEQNRWYKKGAEEPA